MMYVSRRALLIAGIGDMLIIAALVIALVLK